MPRRGNNLLKEDRKVERILCLWNILMRGRGVTREELSAKLKVNERTISRYFADIRGCLAAMEESDGIHRRLIHSREEGVYKMINEGGEYLTSGELFAVCKILLSSKAFHKVEMKALLERLLENLAAAEERAEIGDYIKNELFEYAEPNHKNPDMDLLWKITRAIHQHHVIAFDYKKISAETSSPHTARPLGILFSEYYFYVAARSDRGIKIGATSPLKIYRLDRMTSVIDTGKTFEEPYADRFREGEFKNRVQFMYSGKKIHLEFIYKGLSLEAVLDRLPTAKARKLDDGSWNISADVLGEGILMWLLSQGANVNVLAPESIRQEWLDTARKICEMGKSEQ